MQLISTNPSRNYEILGEVTISTEKEIRNAVTSARKAFSILKAPHLTKGDTIGIIAPAMPVTPSSRQNYERGKKVLQDMGFKLKEGKTIGLQRWWAAGTPQEQAADINTMFADTDVKAIIASAGGHSAISVLEHIDYELIKKHPKPFMGMSDITVYHTAFFAKCGLVGFHTGDLSFQLGWDYKENEKWQEKIVNEMLYHMLTEPNPFGKLHPLSQWECWRAGTAQGKLMGGMVYLLTGQAGTEYFPPVEAFDNAILFVEESGKTLFNIVRLLYHLKYLGIFDRISGMILGKISDLQDFPDKELVFPAPKEAIMDVLKNYNFPILANVDFGHYTANLTMPIGIEASMDAKSLTIEILESAVQ